MRQRQKVEEAQAEMEALAQKLEAERAAVEAAQAELESANERMADASATASATKERLSALTDQVNELTPTKGGRRGVPGSPARKGSRIPTPSR